jgi:hypothetical protein
VEKRLKEWAGNSIYSVNTNISKKENTQSPLQTCFVPHVCYFKNSMDVRVIYGVISASNKALH